MMARRAASSSGSLVAVALGPTMLLLAATCSLLLATLLGEAGCFLLTVLLPASLLGAAVGCLLTFLPLATLVAAWDLAAGSAAG